MGTPAIARVLLIAHSTLWSSNKKIKPFASRSFQSKNLTQMRQQKGVGRKIGMSVNGRSRCIKTSCVCMVLGEEQSSLATRYSWGKVKRSQRGDRDSHICQCPPESSTTLVEDGCFMGGGCFVVKQNFTFADRGSEQTSCLVSSSACFGQSCVLEASKLVSFCPPPLLCQLCSL